MTHCAMYVTCIACNLHTEWIQHRSAEFAHIFDLLPTITRCFCCGDLGTWCSFILRFTRARKIHTRIATNWPIFSHFFRGATITNKKKCHQTCNNFFLKAGYLHFFLLLLKKKIELKIWVNDLINLKFFKECYYFPKEVCPGKKNNLSSIGGYRMPFLITIP